MGFGRGINSHTSPENIDFPAFSFGNNNDRDTNERDVDHSSAINDNENTSGGFSQFFFDRGVQNNDGSTQESSAAMDDHGSLEGKNINNHGWMASILNGDGKNDISGRESYHGQDNRDDAEQHDINGPQQLFQGYRGGGGSFDTHVESNNGGYGSMNVDSYGGGGGGDGGGYGGGFGGGGFAGSSYGGGGHGGDNHGGGGHGGGGFGGGGHKGTGHGGGGFGGGGHGYGYGGHVKTVYVTKEVPVPYPVHVEKKVLYPIRVPYEKPVPYPVHRPYPVHIEKQVPYPVRVHVPQPYPVTVEKHVPYPVKVHVEKPVAVHVPKPYPVYIEKKVHIAVDHPVPYPVKIPIDRPVPIHIPVEKPIPYPVERKIPYPVKVPVDRPYPVHVPRPYPVHVDRPVPYPVKVPVKVPIKVPVPYPVEIKVPVHVPVHAQPPHHGYGNIPAKHHDAYQQEGSVRENSPDSGYGAAFAHNNFENGLPSFGGQHQGASNGNGYGGNDDYMTRG